MAKYKITYSGSFRKDLKKYQKQQKELKAILKAIELLESGISCMPERMRPHKLSGNYTECWECHVLPDLLLIWEQEDNPINEIHLIRLGSHSELF